MSHEHKQLHSFLDELTKVDRNTTPTCSDDLGDANARLQLILDTSAFMAQLVEDINPVRRTSAR